MTIASGPDYPHPDAQPAPAVAEGTPEDIAAIAAMSQHPGFPGIGYIVGENEACPDGYHQHADGTHHVPGKLTTGLLTTTAVVGGPGVPVDPIPDAGQRLTGDRVDLLPAPVPLLARAHTLLRRTIVVWIAGGIRLDGILTDVDDDELVLTVEDNQDVQYVALESVAAMSVKK